MSRVHRYTVSRGPRTIAFRKGGHAAVTGARFSEDTAPLICDLTMTTVETLSVSVAVLLYYEIVQLSRQRSSLF